MNRRRSSVEASPIVRATCTAAEVVGSLVYLAGPEVDGVIPVRLASCHDFDRMPAIGVVVAKLNDLEAHVRRWGVARGLWAGLEPGRTYKVGIDGAISRFAPAAGVVGYACVQFIGVAESGDSLCVEPEFDLKIRHS